MEESRQAYKITVLVVHPDIPLGPDHLHWWVPELERAAYRHGDRRALPRTYGCRRDSDSHRIASWFGRGSERAIQLEVRVRAGAGAGGRH
jgi:hypothetical protein